MGISMGVLALGMVIILAGYFSTRESSRGFTAKGSTEVQRDGFYLARHLGWHMPASGQQFMAYSGLNDAHPVGRFLVPLPGVCRDLSRAGCEDSTALAYIHWDAKTMPSLTAACLIPDTEALGLSSARYGKTALVLDLASPAYGIATFDKGERLASVEKTQTQRYADGPVRLLAGALLALEGDGVAHLWVVGERPQPPLSSEWGEGSTSLKIDGRLLPQDCVDRLRPGAGGARAEVVLLSARPWVPSNLNGGSPSTAPVVVPDAASYPLRLSVVQPRVLGFKPDPLVGRSSVAIRKCRVNVRLDDELDCNLPDPDLLPVRGVDRLRLELVLGAGEGQEGTRRFEPLVAPMSRLSLCESPECETLDVQVGAITNVTRASESLQNLEFDRFSLLKMQLLRKLRLRMHPSKILYEETFEINFAGLGAGS